MTLTAQTRLFTAIIMIIASISVIAYLKANTVLKQQRLDYEHITAIIQGVFELNLLTTEHLSIRSKRTKVQWQRRHASLTNLLLVATYGFESETESSQRLFKARLDLAKIRDLFFKIIVIENKMTTNTNTNIKIIKAIAVQIRLTSQKIISDINRAGHLSLEYLKKAEGIASLVLEVAIISISIIILGIMVWIEKSFIAPISRLKEYSDGITAGNYHDPIVFKGNNEISKLSSSFNILAETIAGKIDDLTEKTEFLSQSKDELELALAQTRLTEQQYKDIFISAADAIFTIDNKGLILTVNPAGEELFGYNKNELIGENIKIIVSEEHYENHDNYINNYITTGDAKIIGIGRMVEGAHKNGEIITVHLRITDMTRDGKREFIGIIRDMTEDIKAKKIIESGKQLLESTNKELESYAYSISHDLRSPLRSIDGYSMILLEDYADKLDDEAQGYLRKIRKGTSKMGELITDLLKMSRITTEALKSEDIDLSIMAREEMNQLKNDYADKNIEFTCADSMKTKGDKALLQSVIENLLNNAVKYSQNKNPIIIEMDCFNQDNKTVYFVKDNGAGFDMKHKNKLFKAFQRLHKVDQFEGSGIGLANVQRIISRHGGEIWAEAEIDKGATFFFTLNENITDNKEHL